jgi:hypothetical protein
MKYAKDAVQSTLNRSPMSLSDDIFTDAQQAAAREAVLRCLEEWVLQGGDETVMLAELAAFVNEVNAQFRKMRN